ncbi:MAG TPA: hypothetical protein VN844_12065, partial [Pyrinomonadaceae bacterium]|nr:hypothetical protein [Pyrinomonadaceae bacterium]
QLGQRLNEFGIDETLKQSVFEQRVKLAGVEIPNTVDASTQQTLKQVVAGSFVSGFRLIMLLSAGLAVASAVASWLLIGRSRPIHTRKH